MFKGTDIYDFVQFGAGLNKKLDLMDFWGLLAEVCILLSAILLDIFNDLNYFVPTLNFSCKMQL